MATEAAWLNGNRFTERKKQKCALTSTGLLMEGVMRRRGWFLVFPSTPYMSNCPIAAWGNDFFSVLETSRPFCDVGFRWRLAQHGITYKQ
jgi:hypothetical protein